MVSTRLLAAFAAHSAIAAFSNQAFAQSTERREPPPLEVTVTANRSPVAIQRTGSAVTVIPGDEIRKTNPATVLDALRQSPGVSFASNGGVGASSFVSLRGAETRHTLVLIDGIRVGDPTSTGGEFDFANLVVTDIDRIEVLRGPQSALYGSDAIGGVINIITRKGRGEPTASLQIEGGSYKTASVRAAVSGGTRDFSYAFALSGLSTAGYSAYGARIGGLQGFGPFDRDGNQRLAGTARFSWRPVDAIEIEGGLYAGRQKGGYDAAFSGFTYRPDTPSKQEGRLATAYLRGKFTAFDGLLENQVTVSGSRTERVLNDVQRYDLSNGFGPPLGLVEERNRYGFTGERTGIEYQGTLNLGAYGRTIFGGGLEREKATFYNIAIANSFQTDTRDRYARDASSAFLLHQVTLLDRLDLSAGGRIDKVDGVKAFNTGRFTAAWRITETGTKLRASFGTGAKAPSLYQQFSIYGPQRAGEPALRPEYSVGGDVGIDQTLFDGRMTVSVTLFANRIRDLISFDGNRGTLGFFGPIGQYINVARARTQGVEVSADANVIDGLLRVRGTYTYLDARDAKTDLKLARRPEHQGRVGLMITPFAGTSFAGLSIEPSVVMVGERFSSPGEKLKLSPYARFDLLASYKINSNVEIYARGENLTNARYQEVATYGTAGRSAYLGVRATW
jgi:vitamin B12 transporter